jgi:predicted O-methyltransferase YrrM
MPEIAVSANLGKLLCLLVQISGSERVLEIGTLGGYSTIWLARGLPAAGSIVSLELLDDHAAVARQNLARAGVSEMVDILIGPAADSLAELIAADATPFDFIFLDADKESYPVYLERALALSRPGTLIVADNVVRKGAVFDASQSDPILEGVRRFLSDVSDRPNLSAVGLQLVGAKGYDGIVIARVTEL